MLEWTINVAVLPLVRILVRMNIVNQKRKLCVVISYRKNKRKGKKVPNDHYKQHDFPGHF